MSPKLKEALGLQEAMDNLAAIAEIDLESPPPIGIVKKSRIVTSEEEFPKGTVEWLSGEGSEGILEILDATYRGVRNHLQDLYQNPETNWESEKLKKGVSAMMALVGESAHKMDRYLAYRLNRPLQTKVEEREEFRILHQFYTKRFLRKFQGEMEETEEEEAPFFEEAKGKLLDFETIRRDREYELFSIRNEEGAPYFHPELFRDLKLAVDFGSEGGSFEEDPLLKIRAMQDRDIEFSARQILGDCQPALEDFFKISRKFPESEIVHLLNCAIIALFLASNPRYLVQNTEGKSCLQYFNDFHQFLRSCLKATEYQKWIAYAPDQSDKSAKQFLSLTHLLCRSLFCRVGGVRQEMIGLIHRTGRKGEELAKKKQGGETLWSQFLFEDENMRTWMAKFPNGPFFKILDLIREEEEEDQIIPFDPIAQGNLPSHLYDLQCRGKKIEVLRIPSPTRQAFINKAEVIDEFRGFLRSFSEESHLIIHLQDRTSWLGVARCRAIESLQKNAEFSHCIHVLTLPKDTDFYYQNNEYVHLSQAEEFFAALKAQLASQEEGGFFFPPTWKGGAFIDALLSAIHRHFFESKKSLTRQNREDFIEIFYQFLILKVIEEIQPTSISFTCKDAVDTGAAAGACFYGFVSLLTRHFSTPEEYDFFRWLLYAPALMVRERIVDVERFTRTVSALERCEAAFQEKATLKTFSELYDSKTLKALQVKHL